MDPASKYFNLMTASDSDIVTFTFKKQEGKVVRCLKSFLVKQSKVFAAMFDEIWDIDTVQLDDYVHFDEYDTFLWFINALIGCLDLTDIAVYRSCCLYFYAEKYEIDGLKSKLISLLPLRRTKIPELVGALQVVYKSNLIAMKDAIDSTIKLDLNDDNAVCAHKVCNIWEMEKLANQALDYIVGMEYESSWPLDLVLRIAEKNRQDLNRIKQMFDGKRQVTTGCINLCGKRNRKNECEKCHSMWTKLKKRTDTCPVSVAFNFKPLICTYLSCL